MTLPWKHFSELALSRRVLQWESWCLERGNHSWQPNLVTTVGGWRGNIGSLQTPVVKSHDEAWWPWLSSRSNSLAWRCLPSPHPHVSHAPAWYFFSAIQFVFVLCMYVEYMVYLCRVFVWVPVFGSGLVIYISLYYWLCLQLVSQCCFI